MPNLLNMGEMGAIALHLLLDLAATRRKSPAGRRSAKDIAESLNASVHTLQKVARRLTMSGWIDGSRGPGGGFLLIADPAALSLLDVIQGVEGPVGGNGCLFGKRVCPAGTRCAFSGLTESLERQVLDYYRNTTLADLLAGTESGAENKKDKP